MARSVRLIAAVQVALAGLVLGPTALAIVELPGVIATTWSTALLSGAVAWVAIGKKSAWSAGLSCVGLALVAAFCNSPITVCSEMLFSPTFFSAGGPDGLWVPVLATIFGAPVAIPTGMALGALYLGPVLLAWHVRRRLSHESADRLLAWGGLWLTALSVVSVVICLSAPDTAIGGLPPPGWDAVRVLAWSALCIGAAMVLLGAARMLVRRLWLKRVLRGSAGGWYAMPMAEVEQDTGDVLPLFAGRRQWDTVIFRATDSHPGGPYRGIDYRVPWALA